MTTNYFSTFIEDNYFKEFIAFYNSYLYYQHQTPLKVYIVGPLRDDRREHIKELCTVVDDPNLCLPRSKYKLAMKYLGLIDHMGDYELCLDVDTLFLSNLDHLFQHIHQGKLLVAHEQWANLHPWVYLQPGMTEHSVRNSLRPYLGDSVDSWDLHKIIVGFNGGFVGVNRQQHRTLLQKVIEILYSSWNFGILNNNEQYTMNLVSEIWKIDKYVLPYSQYMNTWDYHSTPKVIKIQNQKISLFSEDGEQIYFYHFTGGLTCRYDGNDYKCNPGNAWVPHSVVENFLLHDLRNPVILIWNYFYNLSNNHQLLNMK